MAPLSSLVKTTESTQIAIDSGRPQVSRSILPSHSFQPMRAGDGQPRDSAPSADTRCHERAFFNSNFNSPDVFMEDLEWNSISVDTNTVSKRMLC